MIIFPQVNVSNFYSNQAITLESLAVNTRRNICNEYIHAHTIVKIDKVLHIKPLFYTHFL